MKEKTIYEIKYKKHKAEVEPELFSSLSATMGPDIYPVEAYLNAGGSVERNGQELLFVDARVYFKKSQ